MEHTSTYEWLTKTDYQHLMDIRIRKILLICSSYDAYILEEDGRIESQINREYIDLNLSNPPSFIRVTSGDEALEALKGDGDIDLVITMYNIGEMDVFTLSKSIKATYPHIPVVLMTHFSNDIYRKIESEDRSAIDYIFCWHGNADLIIAIIKIIEDKMNADRDILQVGVQAILLVEDSVRYYSTYLPAIYKLVLQQSNEFLKEALGERQQLLQKRARPKILLATNYNDAVDLYKRYNKNLLGVISDVGFMIDKNDKSEDEKLDAGIDLCKLIKKDDPLMPFLLQSSQQSISEVAKELGVGFIVKHSKTLLMELSEYISREFAFGDFVFIDPETKIETGRARDLRELQIKLGEISDEALLYHTSQNHMSKWMNSRGLFPLAAALRKRTNDSFDSVKEEREFIIENIKEYRALLGQGVVARFDPDSYNDYIWFARLGEGSLGGKARGLAFINSILQKYNIYDKYPGLKVAIPRTVVVATDYFDQFITQNGLQYVINSDISDEEILSEFVSSRLPEKLVDELRVYLKYTSKPLAVRSSSKLEDSHYQPFAGIYSTYMIPITGNPDQTLRLLGKAIKSVYASVYFAASRAYITATGNVISEEKMGVVIQQVCGSEDKGFYYPTISGVARSINCYPIGNEKSEDGVVNMALGLGKLVVEGGLTLRFCPKYPKNILQLSTPELALRDTQREMYALNLKAEEFKTSINDAVNLERFEINSPAAKEFKGVKQICSTWDMQNQTISDSSFMEGRKIVSFAHILKYDTLPLAQVISDLLALGAEEMRTPVEIEFAVNTDTPMGQPKEFDFLQIRPIIDSNNSTSMDWSNVDTANALIYAQNAIGTGAVMNVQDVVYVPSGSFDSANSEKIAAELLKINNRMKSEERNYILVGPGRWGSSDPWLGIPVKWNYISQAKVIVECGLESFNVEPSQGTHFFQNLTSFGVGYLTINPYRGDGVFNEKRFDSMAADIEGEFLRVVHFDKPLNIFVDGRENKAIVEQVL